MDFDKFLERDNVKELISQNDLEKVYELLHAGYRPGFTNYLRAKGVNALEYLDNYIPTSAFEGLVQLPTEIQINDSVTYIAQEAFYDNDWIETVKLPKSLVEVDSHAFANCSNVTTFIYPGTIKELRAVKFNEYWFNWRLPIVKCLDDICTVHYSGKIKDKSFITEGK